MPPRFGTLLADIQHRKEAMSEREIVTKRERMTACNGFHTVTDLVAAQAVAAPSRLAVCDGDLTLTYAMLETRANRLARHLAGHGAGRERLVALVLPRSADLVIGALAALKA